MSIHWYLNRLRRMTPQEVSWRVRDEVVKRRWRALQGEPAAPVMSAEPSFDFAPLDPAALDLAPDATRDIVAEAEKILAGRIRLFERDMALPQSAIDWFTDPDSGRIAPSEAYTFDIDSRDPGIVGNLTFTPSRLIHVTLLASAYALTGRADFAELAAAQLKSWWDANPFLTGIHWTAGIECGMRLVTFAWTRRLLARWPGVAALFENSALARDQIYRHQFYLGGLRSYGSSANNHLIAEYLGLYVGATAFPWFPETARWREIGRAGLEEEARLQVFPDGVGRELASEYNGFTMELLMVAALEGVIAGRPLSAPFHHAIARLADAWAASLDVALRPPRQGDTDDAYALLVDPPGRHKRAIRLLAEAAALVGPAPWWPELPRDMGSALVKEARRRSPAALPSFDRPPHRPNLFPDAGLAFLRDLDGRRDELWVRCDHGPHGYLAIAGHAHADALSIELRHAGVDVLVDPGTYCYLTDPVARRYFRSTIAHNTLEIGGGDSATYGGSFLWLDSPNAAALSVDGLDGGPVASWRARHDGYAKKKPGQPIHERSVTLDRAARRVDIADKIAGQGRFDVRLAYHFGPAVEARADGDGFALAWQANGRRYTGRLTLPAALGWQVHRGATDPMLGWYSPAFHEMEPATSLVGSGSIEAGAVLAARLQIDP
ncbi:MAG TPA: alginate lyase family protein [Stellaceae bacterium]|nr:alginate lyase family protein [Stellaceae bacterium]